MQELLRSKNINGLINLTSQSLFPFPNDDKSKLLSTFLCTEALKDHFSENMRQDKDCKKPKVLNELSGVEFNIMEKDNVEILKSPSSYKRKSTCCMKSSTDLKVRKQYLNEKCNWGDRMAKAYENEDESSILFCGVNFKNGMNTIKINPPLEPKHVAVLSANHIIDPKEVLLFKEDVITTLKAHNTRWHYDSFGGLKLSYIPLDFINLGFKLMYTTEFGVTSKKVRTTLAFKKDKKCRKCPSSGDSCNDRCSGCQLVNNYNQWSAIKVALENGFGTIHIIFPGETMIHSGAIAHSVLTALCENTERDNPLKIFQSLGYRIVYEDGLYEFIKLNKITMELVNSNGKLYQASSLSDYIKTVINNLGISKKRETELIERIFIKLQEDETKASKYIHSKKRKRENGRFV